VPILLVGTKFDLITDETTYHDEVATSRSLVDEFGLLGCAFTSAKTGMNVDETIAFLVDTLLYQAYLSESANGAII
jgi:GTPase SAR1 family protein